MTTAERIEALVRARPNLTERQLSEMLFPEHPYQQRVNQACRHLTYLGRIKRQGQGGSGSPFRYRTS
jgi:hypothetical protein